MVCLKRRFVHTNLVEQEENSGLPAPFLWLFNAILLISYLG